MLDDSRQMVGVKLLEVDLVVNEVSHEQLLLVGHGEELIAGGRQDALTLSVPNKCLRVLEGIEVPEEDVGIVEEVDEVLPIERESRIGKEAGGTVESLFLGEGLRVPEDARFAGLAEHQLAVAAVVQLADSRAVACEFLFEFECCAKRMAYSSS